MSGIKSKSRLVLPTNPREHSRLREKLKRADREEERIRQHRNEERIKQCGSNLMHDVQYVSKEIDIADCTQLLMSAPGEVPAEDRLQVFNSITHD